MAVQLLHASMMPPALVASGVSVEKDSPEFNVEQVNNTLNVSINTNPAALLMNMYMYFNLSIFRQHSDKYCVNCHHENILH